MRQTVSRPASAILRPLAPADWLTQRPRRAILLFALGTLAAFLAAIAATYALGRLLPVQEVAGWLFLPFVLLVTIRWGLLPGVGAALLADLLIVLFAIEPIGTLAIRSASEYLRLGVSAVGLIVAASFVWFFHRRGLAAERTLAAQTERAEAIEARYTFLSAVSHDLRSPLTTV